MEHEPVGHHRLGDPSQHPFLTTRNNTYQNMDVVEGDVQALPNRKETSEDRATVDQLEGG
jgi:hypothetical protein